MAMFWDPLRGDGLDTDEISAHDVPSVIMDDSLPSERGGALDGSVAATTRVFMVAANPPTGDAVVIEAEGVDEAEAVATARAKVPPGWRTMNVRRC